jgi:hypothetical protein
MYLNGKLTCRNHVEKTVEKDKTKCPEKAGRKKMGELKINTEGCI